MKRKNLALALLTMALLFTTGISRAESTPTVKIGGTGFGLELMRILANNYPQEQAKVEFVVFPSLGSSGGIKALLAGELDLAISSRPLRPAGEKQQLQENELLKTPFVFITNPSVARDSITTRELEQIYSGRMLSWADGSRIRVILRPRSETDTEITRGLSPVMNEAINAASVRPGMILAVTDQENLESMEKTPGALGGGTLTQILSENRHVKILKLNGLAPSVKALQDGSYPLSKTLYLITGTETSPATRQFVAFIHSGKGEKILTEYGNLIRTNPRPGP